MTPEADAVCRRRSAWWCAEAAFSVQNPLTLPCADRFQVEAGSVIRGNVSDCTGIMRAGADLCGRRHTRQEPGAAVALLERHFPSMGRDYDLAPVTPAPSDCKHRQHSEHPHTQLDYLGLACPR